MTFAGLLTILRLALVIWLCISVLDLLYLHQLLILSSMQSSQISMYPIYQCELWYHPLWSLFGTVIHTEKVSSSHGKQVRQLSSTLTAGCQQTSSKISGWRWFDVIYHKEKSRNNRNAGKKGNNQHKCDKKM